MGDELTLLGPRSRVARLPEIFVRRPRLDAMLGDGERHPITLISAPPGAGKTTLVSAAFGSRRDVVLVIDDVHELRSPDPPATPAHLVGRAPPQIDLVLCSRADPPVRLTRLRL